MSPLIQHGQLKKEHPNVSHPWYADAASVGGKISATRKQFERLQELGPAQGCFTKQKIESILVVREVNLKAVKAALGDLGF
jgi:hypothetical protein